VKGYIYISLSNISKVKRYLVSNVYVPLMLLSKNKPTSDKICLNLLEKESKLGKEMFKPFIK